MLGQGKELVAIDFAHIIGGPLVAVINAQAMSANVTSSFIQHIAFDNQGGGGTSTKLKTVDFDFQQLVGTAGGMTGDSTKIKVPLITMIPIPYIRVDNMTIDFNVNLHKTETTKISNNFTFQSDESSEEGADFIWSESCSMHVSVTDVNTFQNDQTTDDTYSLKVTVHAVQDQMPGGMSQILGIFSNVIQQQAALIQAVVTSDVQARVQQLQLNKPADEKK